jgi:S1-C subfamily serine protease
MTKFLSGLGFSLTALLGLFLPPETVKSPCDCCPPPSLQRQVVDPYVQVSTNYGTGSGTALQVGGKVLVLTAGHVVEEVHEAKGKNDGKEKVKLIKKSHKVSFEVEAEVVAYSPADDASPAGHDLALLLPAGGFALATAELIAKGDPLELGEDAWTIGTPGGLHASLDRSIISITHKTIQEPGKAAYPDSFVVVNGNVWYGSSGGGLFVRRATGYKLCGVVVRAVASPSDYPKCPGGAKNQETIHAFLEAYLKGTK